MGTVARPAISGTGSRGGPIRQRQWLEGVGVGDAAGGNDLNPDCVGAVPPRRGPQSADVSLAGGDRSDRVPVECGLYQGVSGQEQTGFRPGFGERPVSFGTGGGQGGGMGIRHQERTKFVVRGPAEHVRNRVGQVHRAE